MYNEEEQTLLDLHKAMEISLMGQGFTRVEVKHIGYRTGYHEGFTVEARCYDGDNLPEFFEYTEPTLQDLWDQVPKLKTREYREAKRLAGIVAQVESMGGNTESIFVQSLVTQILDATKGLQKTLSDLR